MSTTDYNADLDGVIKGILAHNQNLTHEQVEALNKQVYEKLTKIIDERVEAKLEQHKEWVLNEISASIMQYDDERNERAIQMAERRKEFEELSKEQSTPIIPQEVIDELKAKKKK